MMDARVDQNDVRWTDILMESMENMSKTSGISTYLNGEVFGISHTRCDICKETFPDNLNKCIKCQHVDNRIRSCQLCQSQKVTYWCYDCNSYLCTGCEKNSNLHNSHKIFATEGCLGSAFQRSTWSSGLQSMIRNQIRSKKRKRDASEEAVENEVKNVTSKQPKTTTVSAEKSNKEIHRQESSSTTTISQPLSSSSKDSINYSTQRCELDIQSNNPIEVDQTTNQIPLTSEAIPIYPPPSVTLSNTVIEERPVTPTEDIAQIKEEVVSRNQVITSSAAGSANGGTDEANRANSSTSQGRENRKNLATNITFKQEQIWHSDQNQPSLPTGISSAASSIPSASQAFSGESSLPPVATPIASSTVLSQTAIPYSTSPFNAVTIAPASISASAPVQSQPQPSSQAKESTNTSSMSFDVSSSLVDPLKIAVIEEYNKINDEVLILENRLHEATLAVKNYSLNNLALAARLNDRMHGYRGLLASKSEERYVAVAKVIVYAANVRVAAEKIENQNLGDIPHVLTSCHKRCAQLSNSIRQHQNALTEYHQEIEKVISEGNINQFQLLQTLGNKIKDKEQAIQAADQERDHQFTIMTQYSQKVRQAVEQYLHQDRKKLSLHEVV